MFKNELECFNTEVYMNKMIITKIIYYKHVRPLAYLNLYDKIEIEIQYINDNSYQLKQIK